ncbi:MAG: hypothetical protein ACP5FT_03960 [Acidilobus sp.]
MWFTVGVVYIAALSIVDFTLFNYIGFDPKVTYVEFSVISGAWSAVFVLSNELLGRLADRGEHGRLAELSTATIAASAVLFTISRGSIVLMGAAYMLHAVATASANLAFSTGLFELTPAESWEFRTSIQRLGLYSLRGLALLTLAALEPLVGTLGPIVAALVLAAVAGVALTFTLPPSMPLLERRLSKAFRGLSAFSVYTSSLAAFVGGRYGILYSLSAQVETRPSPLRLGLAAAFSAFVGDYFLTALPLYLRSESFTYVEYTLAFGAAGLAAALGLIVIDALSAGPCLVAGLVIARGLWMAALLTYVRGLAGLALYVTVSLVLFASVELMLYRLFVKQASGYGVHTYAVLKEIGSLMGSLAGGVALLGGTYVFLGLPLASTLISAALVLVNSRVKI